MRNRRGDPFTACIQARGITGISYSLQARLWVTRNGTATDTAPLDFVECLHATYFVQSPRSCAIIYHGALQTTTRSAALRRYSVSSLQPSGYTFSLHATVQPTTNFSARLAPGAYDGVGDTLLYPFPSGDLEYLGLHATRIVSPTRFFHLRPVFSLLRRAYYLLNQKGQSKWL